jgi:hypothetical protein
MLSTPVPKIKQFLSPKTCFLLKLGKNGKGTKNRNQRVILFFIACLSDKVQGKNTWNPSPVLFWNLWFNLGIEDLSKIMIKNNRTYAIMLRKI